MSKPQADQKTPASLVALGGWASADWFCPSVLVDDEVVGFTLPKLEHGRKQSFRLVDRFASPPANDRPGRTAERMPKRAANGIEQILGDLGAVNQAAFRRATLLFDSAPILHFAKLPSSNLKIRAANKLRLTLLESDHIGCVLYLEDAHVTAMFWPVGEVELTGYVIAAAPPYALHVQFQQAENTRASLRRGERPGLKSPTQDREHLSLRRANTSLLREIATLRTQIDQLQQSRSALGAMESLGLDDARLKSMLLLLHPDKHGNSAAANDAAKWINGLRDLLKGR